MGHTYGDDLISGFARILKETFEKEAVVGRMGGDEFIVIIRSDDGRIDYKTFRKKLQHVIDEYNHKESRLSIVLRVDMQTAQRQEIIMEMLMPARYIPWLMTGCMFIKEKSKKK